ncbi:MAG: glycosyltransferase [Bacteroidia bacterium]|nr:glycosyltransferase [Bacteroidia bacterium]
MKIIHVILGKARIDRMNGINKVAHNLALQQLKSGHDVEIWGITPSPGERPPDRPYILRLFQANKNKFRLDEELVRYLEAMEASSSHFHIHGSFITEFYWLSRLLLKKSIPYTYCPHGSLSPGALQKSAWRKRIYFRFFESRIIKNAQAVQFLGQTQYDYIDKLIKLDNKVLIPNGQNLEELDFQAEARKQFAYPIFSYCGRLDRRHKGLDILIEGFTRYREGGGKGKLWLIGDGKDMNSLKAQAQMLGVRKLIKFWGPWFGEEKLRLLYQSDAFIHTSRYEGLPTSVLEAAGIGLPVILSTPTNLGAFFADRKAGIHIEVNDADAVAAALKEAEDLKSLSRLKQMGKTARTIIEDEFNWENIANQVLKKAYKI